MWGDASQGALGLGVAPEGGLRSSRWPGSRPVLVPLLHDDRAHTRAGQRTAGDGIASASAGAQRAMPRLHAHGSGPRTPLAIMPASSPIALREVAFDRTSSEGLSMRDH